MELYSAADRARFASHVDLNGPEIIPGSRCHVWTKATDRKGYGIFTKGGKNLRAARVSLEIGGVEIPAGQLACHHCDNPPCLRFDHLFPGRPLANSSDMIRKGRAPAVLSMPHSVPRTNRRGDNNRSGRALTADDVREIRRRRFAGEASNVALAREYGVSKQAIGNIVSGKQWKDVI